MGRSPSCDENGLKKGPWTPEEDEVLIKYIQKHGHGSWRALPKLAGLNRCGKSCRLRWTNYLRPDIKRGKFSPEEEQTILNLHSVLGNKWSAISSHLPGRTDNEIKNFWNTHLKKKLIQMGFDPMTHRPRTDIFSSLSQLMALANLKGLMDQQQYPLEEQALLRLQAETAKLQYLQYLLQPPSMNNINFSDIENLSFLNSISLIKDTPIGNNMNLGIFNSCLQEVNNLPDLKTLDSSHETLPVNKDILDLQAPAGNLFQLFSHKENLSISPIWFAEPSSSNPSPPPFFPPSVTENSVKKNIMEDGCSTITTSSCQGTVASELWPDLLLDDSLFHEIP